jgi:hypothetical protein
VAADFGVLDWLARVVPVRLVNCRKVRIRKLVKD